MPSIQSAVTSNQSRPARPNGRNLSKTVPLFANGPPDFEIALDDQKASHRQAPNITTQGKEKRRVVMDFE
jgi:hypothetical protein